MGTLIENPLKILYTISDGINEYNSSRFRATIPANALRKIGIPVKFLATRQFLSKTKHAEKLLNWADVIIIQRVLMQESYDTLIALRNAGKCVIVDFDDAYHLIQEDNAAYEFWGNGQVDVTYKDGSRGKVTLDVHPVEQFKNGLGAINAITTPSHILGTEYDSIHYRIPNYIPKSEYSNVNIPIMKGITIGWGGSLSHVLSFNCGVMEALSQIMSERKNIFFHLVGDARVLDKFPQVLKERTRFTNYVPFYEWPKIIQTYNIGIAPLFNPYDQRRSDLKVKELIAAGVPFVATKSIAYRDLYDIKSGIFVEQGDDTSCHIPSPENWYNALSKVIDEYTAYRALASGYRNRVDIFDIDTNAISIYNTYKQIVKDTV